MRWQVQEAKQRLSEVLRGESVGFVDCLRASPHLEDDLPVERPRDEPREIDLVS
jgi:hypothetical protein